MRILQIIQKPQRRGAEIFAYHFSEQLLRTGHDVRNVYLYSVPEKDSLPIRINDVLIEADEDDFQEKFPGWNFGILRKLRGLLRSFQPQVVQANAARTVKYAALLRRLAGSSPWILVYRNIGDPQIWLKGKYRKWIYRSFIMQQVDGIVAISSESLSTLRKIYHGNFLMKKILNGVDGAIFTPAFQRSEMRKVFDVSPESPLLIYAGSLTYEKRIDRLLRAMKQCVSQIPDLHLWILGDGMLRPELERLTSDLGLTARVRFLGLKDDVASFMNAADLLVLSSDTEGVPGAILEAGLLGLPVVAPRVGGIEDCIVDGQTGLLTEPNDEDALSRAICKLSGDPVLRAQLGMRAQDFIQKNFLLQNIADEYVRFYQEVLNKNAASIRN